MDPNKPPQSEHELFDSENTLSEPAAELGSDGRDETLHEPGQGSHGKKVQTVPDDDAYPLYQIQANTDVSNSFDASGENAGAEDQTPICRQEDSDRHGIEPFPGEDEQNGDKYQPWSTFASLPTVSAAAPTFWSKLFDGLAYVGPLALVALYAFQIFFNITELRLLWHPDEIIQASVLHNVLNGDWLSPQYNGEAYLALPPLYFWFLAGVYKLLQTVGLGFDPDYARTMFSGAAISGLLLLLATMALARWIGHLERRGVFAAGCVLMGAFFFALFIHFANVDLFFAALVTLSHLFIFASMQQRSSPATCIIGFLFAGLAVLTKGAYGLLLPTFGALVYAAAQRQPGRFFKKDIITGIVVALIPVLVWLGFIWFQGGRSAVTAFLGAQWQSLIPAGLENPLTWICFAVALFLIWFPWTVLTPLLPGGGLFGKATGSPSRLDGGRGVCYIWSALIAGFILLLAVSVNNPLRLIAIFPFLAITTGRGILRLSPIRGMIFQRMLALLFVVLAAALAVLPVWASGKSPELFGWLDRFQISSPMIELNGLFIISAIFLIMGCLFFGFSSARRSENVLLILVLGVSAASYPLNTMTMPSLNALFSPQGAVQAMTDYSALGYRAATYEIAPGIFTVMSGGTIAIMDLRGQTELDALLQAAEPAALAMPYSAWARLRAENRTAGLRENMSFHNGFKRHVILLKEAPDQATPDQAMPE